MPGGALRAAIARVGTRSGKRHGPQRLQLARCLGHQQAHLPMAGMKSKRNGLAVFGAQAAVGAQDQEFGIEKAGGIPAHPGALRQTEEIARGLGEQHLRGERQRTGRAARVRGYAEADPRPLSPGSN